MTWHYYSKIISMHKICSLKCDLDWNVQASSIKHEYALWGELCYMLIFAFYYWLSHFVSGNNEWYILPLFFVHVYCFDITCVICIVFVPSIIVCDVFCCVQWLILFLFEVLKIVVIFTERYSLFFGILCNA